MCLVSLLVEKSNSFVFSSIDWSCLSHNLILFHGPGPFSHWVDLKKLLAEQRKTLPRCDAGSNFKKSFFNFVSDIHEELVLVFLLFLLNVKLTRSNWSTMVEYNRATATTSGGKRARNFTQSARNTRAGHQMWPACCIVLRFHHSLMNFRPHSRPISWMPSNNKLESLVPQLSFQLPYPRIQSSLVVLRIKCEPIKYHSFWSFQWRPISFIQKNKYINETKKIKLEEDQTKLQEEYYCLHLMHWKRFLLFNAFTLLL